MDYKALKWSVHDNPANPGEPAIGVITLNRPEKRNSLNRQMMADAEFRKAGKEVIESPKKIRSACPWASLTRLFNWSWRCVHQASVRGTAMQAADFFLAGGGAGAGAGVGSLIEVRGRQRPTPAHEQAQCRRDQRRMGKNP